MKQAVLVFPVGNGREVAKFFAENGVVTNLSYSETDGWFNTKICAIVCFPGELEDKVKANLSKWIKP